MSQNKDLNNIDRRSEQRNDPGDFQSSKERAPRQASPYNEGVPIGDRIISDSPSVLAQTADNLYTLAEEHRDDSLFLLSLLRDLEKIHRQIRVSFFEEGLPKTRNDLYRFVRDIEEKGGWPYIERMRLQDLLKNMKPEQEGESEQVKKI